MRPLLIYGDIHSNTVAYTGSQQHTLHANMNLFNQYGGQQLKILIEKSRTSARHLRTDHHYIQNLNFLKYKSLAALDATASTLSVTAVFPRVLVQHSSTNNHQNSNVVPKSHACWCGNPAVWIMLKNVIKSGDKLFTQWGHNKIISKQNWLNIFIILMMKNKQTWMCLYYQI